MAGGRIKAAGGTGGAPSEGVGEGVVPLVHFMVLRRDRILCGDVQWDSDLIWILLGRIMKS